MKPIVPELSRPLQVDRIPNLGSHETVRAEGLELSAVAKRLGIHLLHSLAGRLHAVPWRGGLKISGNVIADLEQNSVVTLEPFRSVVEFQVERYFMPRRATVPESEEDIDIIEHGEVDVGEVVVETLALELDPYPRKPGEVFNSRAEDAAPLKANPFDALKTFKSK